MCLPPQMGLLLEEYLSSADVQEVRASGGGPSSVQWVGVVTAGTSSVLPSLQACRCLSDLDVPHFHHELVYEVRSCFQPAVCTRSVDDAAPTPCRRWSWALSEAVQAVLS